MKLINFIAFSALIFGTMACSSESMIDGEPSSSSEVTGVTENNAYLSVNLNTVNPSTKATENVADGGTNDSIAQKIQSCTVILYNSSTKAIKSINDNLTLTGDSVNVLLYTKVESNLSVMVIANSTTTFADKSITTIDDAKSIVQTAQSAASFDEDNLVKVGSAAVDFPAGFGSTYTGADKTNTKEVDVTVSQLTACVRLAGFEVTNYTGKAAEVNIESVTLNQINLSEATGFSELNTSYDASKTIDLNRVVYDGSNNVALSTIPTFFSFQNTNADKLTSMTVKFTVGDQEYTKTYIIKHLDGTSGIHSGYLYNLLLKMSITNNKIDVNFVTYTYDWNDGGSININMTRGI